MCICFVFFLLFFFSVWYIRSVGRSENGDAESDETTTCCKLCKCCTPCYASALCLPCRRLKKLSCCKRTKKLADDEKAAEIATSILHESETKATATTESCWRRMKCCKRQSKQVEEKIMDEVTTMEEQTMQRAESLASGAEETVVKERGKCALCLAKVFCCRKTNKIQTSSEEMMASTTAPTTMATEQDTDVEKRRCCMCLPCRRKKKEPKEEAWMERRQDSLTSTEPMPKK